MSGKKERIILDTNLWISFLISKDFSKLDQVLLYFNAVLVFSEELLDEFISVAQRPKLRKFFSTKDIEDILELLDEYAEFIKVKSKITICRDKKDNFLLSLSVDGDADFLITGDKDLLELKEINQTKIVTIEEYLRSQQLQLPENEEKFKTIAKQLRRPQGDQAIEVAQKMNQNNRLMNLHTIKALAVKPNDRLLEIGMGNGFFVKDIFEIQNSIQYHGCDYSEIMVDEARKNNELLVGEGRAEFLIATADKLPFEDQVFDKIFSVNTIYFWEDPEKTLAEIYRVLNTQGRLFLSLRPKSSMKHYPFVKYGFDMFTRAELSTLLSENRFMITDYWEEEEPEMEFDGKKMKVETLIISAEKQPQLPEK